MLSKEEKINLLRSVDMLDGASDSTLQQIAELSTEETFGEGEDLIVFGKRCSKLYVSIEGEFAVYVPDGDIMREVARLGSGKVFGEIGAVSGLTPTATVRSLTPGSRLLSVPVIPFHRIVSRSPRLAETVLRSLARYLPGKSGGGD